MKTDKVNKYEICVSCKVQTKVLRDLHIDYRLYYIEGVGQLCDKCGKKYIE
jgi:hypothetical protein